MTDENTSARRSSGNDLSTPSAADDPNFEIVEYDEIYGPPYEVPGGTGLPDDPLTNFVPVPRESDRVHGGWLISHLSARYMAWKTGSSIKTDSAAMSGANITTDC